jgi:hypothetical protein
MPVFKPSGTIKDEAKKAADVKDKEQKFLEHAHLSPLTGRVAGYGWLQTAGVHAFNYACPADEEKLIELVGELFEAHEIVTYDGRGFDYPFLASRASLYESTRKYVNRFASLFAGIQSLKRPTLCEIAENIGLSYWQAENAFTRRNVLTLKELAGFYGIEGAPKSLAFHQALAAFRREGIPKPDELDYELTADQKLLNQVMGEYLHGTCVTIDALHKVLTRTPDQPEPAAEAETPSLIIKP